MVWGAVSWAEAQQRLVEKGLGREGAVSALAQESRDTAETKREAFDMSVPFHGALNEVSSLESMFIAFLFMGKQKFCPNYSTLSCHPSKYTAATCVESNYGHQQPHRPLCCQASGEKRQDRREVGPVFSSSLRF